MSERIKGIVVTDFDGTIFFKEQGVSDQDINTLIGLHRENIIRVIATGRSLYSILKVIDADFPVDYLVFSSGAGIYDWNKKELLFSKNMSKTDCFRVFRYFTDIKADFSIQDPIPDNHRYSFVQFSKNNPDFDRRNNLYQDFATNISPDEFSSLACSQFIAILPSYNGEKHFQHAKTALEGLKVIRSTSPIDHNSVWIEVFAENVSKASGAAFIAKQFGIKSAEVMFIGNDYNDSDILHWAGFPYITGNSPDELKKFFTVKGTLNRSAFSDAVDDWAKQICL